MPASSDVYLGSVQGCAQLHVRSERCAELHVLRRAAQPCVGQSSIARGRAPLDEIDDEIAEAVNRCAARDLRGGRRVRPPRDVGALVERRRAERAHQLGRVGGHVEGLLLRELHDEARGARARGEARAAREERHDRRKRVRDLTDTRAMRVGGEGREAGGLCK